MKKNQLALVFLTLITMLAVWYFKSPNSTVDEVPTIIVTNTSTRNEKLASMRDAIRNERNETLKSLNDVLADENATLASKTEAQEAKEVLSSLNEQEVLLETKVINLGYNDAFVHSTSMGVEVIVVANESSATAALEIINIINSTFDKNENVVINFMTDDELKQA